MIGHAPKLEEKVLSDRESGGLVIVKGPNFTTSTIFHFKSNARFRIKTRRFHNHKRDGVKTSLYLVKVLPDPSMGWGRKETRQRAIPKVMDQKQRQGGKSQKTFLRSLETGNLKKGWLRSRKKVSLMPRHLWTRRCGPFSEHEVDLTYRTNSSKMFDNVSTPKFLDRVW